MINVLHFQQHYQYQDQGQGQFLQTTQPVIQLRPHHPDLRCLLLHLEKLSECEYILFFKATTDLIKLNLISESVFGKIPVFSQKSCHISHKYTTCQFIGILKY